MDYLRGFLGSTAILRSRTWGPLTVEAVSFSPAADVLARLSSEQSR